MSIIPRTGAVLATLAVVVIAAPPGAAAPHPGEVVTVAGVDGAGYSGDGGDARQARLGGSVDVAVTPDGRVFVADRHNDVLRVVDGQGVINAVPGLPDGPTAVTTDAAGVLYVALPSRVLRMDPGGTFTVVAGGGTDPDGDGGPATRAKLGVVEDIAVGPDGTVYLTDGVARRIRAVAPDGVITTVAGAGVAGVSFGEDDALSSVAVGRDGDLYFVHDAFPGVTRIDRDGRVAAVVGQDRRPGFAGDGGPAAKARIGRVVDVATDAEGDLYLADNGNQNVRMVDAKGVIHTVGAGVADLAGVVAGPRGDLYVTDGTRILRLAREPAGGAGGTPLARGPARWLDREPGTVMPIAGNGHNATTQQEYGLGVDDIAAGRDGTVFAIDWDGRIIAIRPDGRREPYAGGRVGASTGDGGPAVDAGLGLPNALAVDGAGNLYIADSVAARIRRVDASGTITTVAGTGVKPAGGGDGPNGDGGPAAKAAVEPEHLATGPDGSLYVADRAGGRIRRIDPRGTITSIAGGGDRAPDTTSSPTEADLGEAPSALTVDRAGNVYFVHRDRLFVVSAGGRLSPVGADVRASALAAGPDGTTYLTDTDDNRVAALRPGGDPTTIAGNGQRADAGDGGRATDASLLEPARVTTDAAGNVYVTTADGRRIRRIDPRGTITTIAEFDLVVDGDASRTIVDAPRDVAVDPAGTAYVVGDSPLTGLTADGTARKLADLTTQRDLDPVGGMAAGRDGSVYLVHGDRVDRVYPDGTVVTVAGGAAPTSAGSGAATDLDGKRAVSVVLQPGDVATTPSGGLYLTSGTGVYRVDPGGVLKSVADLGRGGDLGPFAPGTTLSIAVGRTGDVYVADAGTRRVFRVNEAGEATVFAGTGAVASDNAADRGDGDDATDVALSEPRDLAVAADGTVYVATPAGVRRVAADGTIDTVVEPLTKGPGDLGGAPVSIALDPHGNLYLTAERRNVLYAVARPGELPAPSRGSAAGTWFAVGAAAVLVLGVIGGYRYRRGKETVHTLRAPLLAADPAAEDDPPASRQE